MSVIDFEPKVEGSIEEHADLEAGERVEERIEAERGRLRSRISVDGPGERSDLV